MRSYSGGEETEEDRVLRHVEEDVEEEWFVTDAVDVGTCGISAQLISRCCEDAAEVSTADAVVDADSAWGSL